MLLKEAIDLLESTGYIVEEVGDDDWRPSVRDMHLINTGRKPYWAKKVTEIGPREKRPHGSDAHSEVAMRKVTDPRGLKEPYKESDWRNDNRLNKRMYAEIGDKLNDLIYDDFEITATKDYTQVFTKNAEFRIESAGFDYLVFRIGKDSVLDRKTYRCKSLKEVAEYIEKESV